MRTIPMPYRTLVDMHYSQRDVMRIARATRRLSRVRRVLWHNYESCRASADETGRRIAGVSPDALYVVFIAA